jgi:hypothetical protein
MIRRSFLAPILALVIVSLNLVSCQSATEESGVLPDEVSTQESLNFSEMTVNVGQPGTNFIFSARQSFRNALDQLLLNTMPILPEEDVSATFADKGPRNIDTVTGCSSGSHAVSGVSEIDVSRHKYEFQSDFRNCEGVNGKLHHQGSFRLMDFEESLPMMSYNKPEVSLLLNGMLGNYGVQLELKDLVYDVSLNRETNHYDETFHGQLKATWNDGYEYHCFWKGAVVSRDEDMTSLLNEDHCQVFTPDGFETTEALYFLTKYAGDYDFQARGFFETDPDGDDFTGGEVYTIQLLAEGGVILSGNENDITFTQIGADDYSIHYNAAGTTLNIQNDNRFLSIVQNVSGDWHVRYSYEKEDGEIYIWDFTSTDQAPVEEEYDEESDEVDQESQEIF